MNRNIGNKLTKHLGFSLIEMLVVMAVILILLRLLLPGLSGARRAARAVQCANNLKQMILGMHLYSQDWKVWPARGEVGEDYGNSIWVGLQAPVGNPAVSAAKPADMTRGALAKYIYMSTHSRQLYMCPEIERTPAQKYLQDINVSYVMNGQLGNWRNPERIADLAGTYVFIETRYYNCGGTITPNDMSHVCSGCDKAGNVHNNGGYHAFGDGHVVWKRAALVDDDISPSCRGMNPNGPSATD